ncbi:secreted protein, partial [Candidatus Magnetomorum sp. HK-1]
MTYRFLRFFLLLAMLINIQLVNAHSDEIITLMRQCMKGSNANVPIYISFMPFVDIDTKTSSFMTEHATLLYEDMKNFYTELQPILGFKVNASGHSVPSNDMNVYKMMEIINRSGISESNKFSLLENQFLDPYKTDIIITAAYRNAKESLDMIIYFIVKSKKRVIASDMSFSKLTFFCEKMIPFSRASKTVICKNKEDASLVIYLQMFLEKLCPGLINQLTGNFNTNNSGNNQKLQSKSNQQVSLIYITQLSFMDPFLGYSLNNTPQGNLIDKAVSTGIKQASQSNSAIAFNKSGHRINNTNPNCNKLINIIFDPNLEQKQKMSRVTSDLLTPHKTDCIVTGQLITQRNPPDLRVMLIRNNNTIDTQQVPISKNLFCLDPNNPSQKTLCPGMHDKIVQAVKEL